MAAIGAAIGGAILLQTFENIIVSWIHKKYDEEEPTSLQSKHFKVACSGKEVPPGWRLASIKDVRDHSEELQELFSSSKIQFAHCRLAYMCTCTYSISECTCKDVKYNLESENLQKLNWQLPFAHCRLTYRSTCSYSVSECTCKHGKYNVESENFQKLDWQLLTNINLPVVHDLSKELPSKFQIDPKLHEEEYKMPVTQLAKILLSEVRKWVHLRNDTTKILNEINSNFKENEKVTAHVALKTALIVTGLLSILTGNAKVLEYCSVVATVLKIKTAIKLYEYLKEYHCNFILHSAASVISSDVQLSMRIQKLASLFTNSCKENQLNPENILAAGALQYKEIFELIHGEPYKKQDPIQSARVLLDVLQGNRENNSPAGLALNVEGLIDVANTSAIGSNPSDAVSLLLKEVTKMKGGVSEISEKVGALNTPLEREEFREDLCVLFNRLKSIPLSGDKPLTDKNHEIANLYMVAKMCTNLYQLLSAKPVSLQEERTYVDLMCRFLPQILAQQQRHLATKKIEVVLIAHANIQDCMMTVETYLPLVRDDKMIFYQPWGMKVNGEGVAAIATGKLNPQNSQERTFFRPLANGQRLTFKANPSKINAIHREYEQEQLEIPAITIVPFRLEDSYYKEVVEYLKRNEKSFLKDVEVFVWVEESQAYELNLCYITQVLQLYAYSLSNEREPVKLIYKHAACLSDNPQLSHVCQEHCRKQYAYCPKHEQGLDFDFMTFNIQ